MREASIGIEVYSIPLDPEGYLIYAPLRHTALIADAQAKRLLDALKTRDSSCSEDADPALVERLQRLGLIRTGTESISQPPDVIENEGPPLPTSVTLLLTTACNLRCTYCYARAGEQPAGSMSLETARRGIDLVIANRAAKHFVASYRNEAARSDITIDYHGGGEPTLNWRVLTGSFAYAREKANARGLDVTGRLATNGVLRDEQVDWIVEHLESACVSFDGLPAVHDRHRRTVRSQGSSGEVMATLRRLDAAGFPYRIRMTVTDDQVAGLPDSVAFICSRFSPRGIQVEPAYPMGRWRRASSATAEEFVAAYREARSRAVSYGYELDYSSARLNRLSSHYCGVSQDNFVLTADGDVSACVAAFSAQGPFADHFIYGRPAVQGRGYAYDQHRLNSLRRQTVEHKPACQGCFAKWHCAGGCLHATLEAGGRAGPHDSTRCQITRALLSDQLLERTTATNGTCWNTTDTDSLTKT